MRGGCPGFKGPVPQPVSMSLHLKITDVEVRGQRTFRYMRASRWGPAGLFMSDSGCKFLQMAG